MDNEDYHRLNGKTARDERETELYKRMVKAAVRLHKIFPNVRGMTDAVCVLGESKHPNEEMKVDDLGPQKEHNFTQLILQTGEEEERRTRGEEAHDHVT